MSLRQKRTTWTKDDKALLTIYFNLNPYLSPAILETISESLNKSPKSVRTWFRNERKRRNDKLKSEINGKTSKEQGKVPENSDDARQRVIKRSNTNELNSSIDVRETKSPDFIASVRNFHMPILPPYQNFSGIPHFPIQNCYMSNQYFAPLSNSINPIEYGQVPYVFYQ